MKIKAKYSFNQGEAKILEKYPEYYKEILEILDSVDTDKAYVEGFLYNPLAMSINIKQAFKKMNWESYKKTYDAPVSYYTDAYKEDDDYSPKEINLDIDFIKEKLGVEITFSKHPNMVYSALSKMTLFNSLDLVEIGLVIVPIKKLSNSMRIEISSFEQLVWDLEKRGVSNLDIPVLILGVGA